ncbi:MAG: Rdx family protein [Candidatus Eisenbacteria bacterium]|nr:Rdx family protein [Candidatus Eisenbacteria bacterium]
MAKRIEKELGIKPKLIEGSGGIFDIHADEKEIYAKSKTGSFPSDEDVIARLKRVKVG